MIVLRDLTKTYVRDGSRKTVLDRVNAVFPSKTVVGLLGRNGAGKSTLLRMIAGAADVTSGEILTDGQISFPVGFAGSFHAEMTGAQNCRFVARIYGVDTDGLIAYVADFAELGVHFHLPVKTYSAGMKARLAFGVSMGISFDTYLIDETTAVGDQAFRRKSEAVFHDRMRSAGALFVSHSLAQVKEMCTAGAVLEGGRLHYFQDVEEAIDHHLRNMGEADGTRRARALAED